MQHPTKKQTSREHQKGSKDFWQDMVLFFSNIKNTLSGRLQYLKIAGFIGLLIVFSFEIKSPQVISKTLPYPISNASKQLGVIPVPYNYQGFSALYITPKFGYELKGNSYSYPLPFLEEFLEINQNNQKDHSKEKTDRIITQNNRVVP